MTKENYLSYVYANIEPGMKIDEPTTTSEIVRISKKGNIYYRIGQVSEKSISSSDLLKLYEAINKGPLTDTIVKEIAGKNKPCNKTTIKWLVRELNLIEVCRGQA